ncbi:phage minor capsid protein [Rhodococcoides fascians]|uniref:phage minor capsid protein n=1 Tax=Rhodococcoides fascians TaxID=1828 RepID=UPI0012D32EF6|nr:phage minor capsid protein [Rhodococcus fascians]
MPVSEAAVEGVEEPVVAEYSAAELILIGLVASAVAEEIRGSVADKFTRLNRFRNKVRQQLSALTRRGRARAAEALVEAEAAGEDAARETLRRTRRAPDGTPAGRNRAAGTSPADRPSRRGRSASERPDLQPSLPDPIELDDPMAVGRHRAPDSPADLTLDDLRKTAPRGPRTERGVTIRTPNELLPQLQAMTPQMLRSAEEMYQQVMAEVLASPLTSEAERLRLAQKLIDRYAARGITAYIDRGGRRWSMTTFVEMATRTAAAQTAIDAHVTLLAEYGYDLVRVSIHANCSPMCAPFQGHLLSATGATTSDGDEEWRPRVITSLADARRRGFNHPNCKHWVTLWVPGDPLPAAPEVDEADYAATQQLRALERAVRMSKRRRAAAMTPEAAAKANARTRAIQTRIREHVDAHPTVPRMRRREQIDIAR